MVAEAYHRLVASMIRRLVSPKPSLFQQTYRTQQWIWRWLDRLVGFESLDGGGLVVLHQAAATGDIGAEDGGKLAVEAFLFHCYGGKYLLTLLVAFARILK